METLEDKPPVCIYTGISEEVCAQILKFCDEKRATTPISQDLMYAPPRRVFTPLPKELRNTVYANLRAQLSEALPKGNTDALNYRLSLQYIAEDICVWERSMPGDVQPHYDNMSANTGNFTLVIFLSPNDEGHLAVGTHSKHASAANGGHTFTSLRLSKKYRTGITFPRFCPWTMSSINAGTTQMLLTVPVVICVEIKT